MAVLAGKRVRSNSVYGIVSDNPLTVGATTLTSSGLANLAAVSGDHAVLVIDPLGTAGAPEIVLVTAHTAAAGTATISRAAYGTTARQHLQGVLWVHTTTMDDTIRIVTSSTRPSDQYDGQLIHETDTDRTLWFNGTNWTQYRLGGEPDRLFSAALSNGTATTFTAFVTQNSILSLPYPYKMIVQAHINSGANSVANVQFLQVQDESGVGLSPKGVVDGQWAQSVPSGSYSTVWGAIAEKDYAAGATCGFRLAYKVSTSNVFMDGFIRVSFYPNS